MKMILNSYPRERIQRLAKCMCDLKYYQKKKDSFEKALKKKDIDDPSNNYYKKRKNKYKQNVATLEKEIARIKNEL